MPHVRDRARGHIARGRGIDDHASAGSVPGRGRGRRGRGRGVSVESFMSLGHEVVGDPTLLQAMVTAIRDVARAIRDELSPPPPHSPRRETSPNPMEVKFRCYMKDF